MPNDIAHYSLILLQMRMELRNSLVPLLKEHDLSLESWLILYCLSRENKGVTLIHLADRIQGLHMSGISKYVDSLQKRKLLSRHHGQIDRRSIEIMISPSGNKLLELIDKTLTKSQDVINKTIPKEKRKNVIKTSNFKLA